MSRATHLLPLERRAGLTIWYDMLLQRADALSLSCMNKRRLGRTRRVMCSEICASMASSQGRIACQQHVIRLTFK